jgi:hypothetical protein
MAFLPLIMTFIDFGENMVRVPGIGYPFDF